MTQNITNVNAIQEQNKILVSYNLESKEPCRINLFVSDGNGDWKSALQKVTGNVGENVKAGNNKIMWDVLSEFPELKGNDISFKVTADNQQLKIGDFYQGGIIAFIENGHGIIAAPNDLKATNWEDANKECENLALNGYHDWGLPNKIELNKLYINKNKIGGFNSNGYWSSSEKNDYNAWWQLFYNGSTSGTKKEDICNVRAVRTF